MKPYGFKILFIATIILILITIFFIWQNNHLVISEYEYKSKKLAKEFNGFKILHVSDLHNKSFGKDQKYILKKIKEISPDIIVITGDLIDRRRYNLQTSLSFINGALKIAPIYYVAGNHEAWSGKYKSISRELKNCGVIVLEDEKIEITKEGRAIEVLGLKDPGFIRSSYSKDKKLYIIEENLRMMSNDDNFQILLSHRPELIDIYARENMDIIFSGHAHGGQFRIPGIGGLVAPDQGLLPKYTSGAHIIKNSTIYISRGLGNSIIPIRIFNRPELLVVSLYEG